MSGSDKIDGFVDLLILDKMRIVLQDSKEIEDLQLGKWIQDNYLNEPLQPGNTTCPIKTLEGFRIMDKGYKRVRMLTGRAQDEWPFYSRTFKNNATAFRRYALGDDRASEDVPPLAKPSANKAASTQQTSAMSPSLTLDGTFQEAANSTKKISVVQSDTMPEKASDEDSITEVQSEIAVAVSTDSPLNSDAAPRLMSESSENTADSITRRSVYSERPVLAAESEPIFTNLDRLPGDSKKKAGKGKRKRQSDDTSATNSSTASRPNKRQKANKKLVESEVGISKSTRTTNAAPSKKRVTRSSQRKSVPVDSNSDTHSQEAVQDTQMHEDQPVPHVDGQNIIVDEQAQEVVQDIPMKDGELQIPHDEEENPNEKHASSSTPEPAQENTDHSHSELYDTEVLQHGLDFTASRKNSHISLTTDSAVFGMDTTPEHSSPRSVSLPAQALTSIPSSPLPGEAVGTPSIQDIVFFARINTGQGSVEISFNQDRLNDVGTLSTQIQKYAKWKQVVNKDLTFEEWVEIYMMREG